jgi:hypothetical protein
MHSHALSDALLIKHTLSRALTSIILTRSHALLSTKFPHTLPVITLRRTFTRKTLTRNSQTHTLACLRTFKDYSLTHSPNGHSHALSQWSLSGEKALPGPTPARSHTFFLSHSHHTHTLTCTLLTHSWFPVVVTLRRTHPHTPTLSDAHS